MFAPSLEGVIALIVRLFMQSYSMAILLALVVSGCGMNAVTPPSDAGTDANTDAPSASDSASVLDVPNPLGVDVPSNPTTEAGGNGPSAPLLVSARQVVHGTNSLSWQYPDSPCDMVEINRNKDGGPYAVAQTLTGAAMGAQDMPGHAPGRYCYTLTCKRNGMSSVPSNERCVSQ